MKTFLKLAGSYAGFRVRRLAQCGRLQLLQVIGYYSEASENRSQKEYESEPHPYWFVRIENYHPAVDGPVYGWFIRNTQIPSEAECWRFLEKEKAETKFNELSKLPLCLADEEKKQKLREKSKQRALGIDMAALRSRKRSA